MIKDRFLVIKFLLFYFITTLFVSVAYAQERVCILIYERNASGISKQVNDAFRNAQNVDLYNEAIPLDFVDCVKKDYREIIIVAHGVELNNDSDTYKLGYFRRLDEAESEIAKEKTINNYRKELVSLLYRYNDLMAGKVPYDAENYNSFKEELFELSHKIDALRDVISRIKYLPKDHALYKPGIFFNNVFNLAAKHLDSLKEQGLKSKLKSIKLVGCEPNKVLNNHKPLKELADKHSIALNFSPKQNIMSWLKGKHVTVVDKKWIGESGQTQSKNSEGFYVYLKTKNILAYRTGDKKRALRGKYEVSLHGLSVGLGVKWTEIYIKYSDVEDLRVNESKTLILPQLDVALALWVNGELQIGRKLNLLGTSEINSINASVGLIQFVTVKRLY